MLMVSGLNSNIPMEKSSDKRIKKEESQKTVLALEKNGCLRCHTTDGKSIKSPTLKGLFGRKINIIESGKESKITVDEKYLLESIINPGKQIRKGYDNRMPAYKLPENEITKIINEIKQLK